MIRSVIFHHEGLQVEADLSAARSIAIPLDFAGPQPRAFGLSRATQTPYQEGDFIAQVDRQGPINCMQVTLWPHGNGTHTETVGHILSSPPPVGELLTGLHLCALLSVTPERLGDVSEESYPSPAQPDDRVITARSLRAALDALVSSAAPGAHLERCEALIVRALPHGADPRQMDHSGANPPYLTHEAMRWIRAREVKHLLTDLPSVDRERDEGRLSCHRLFWEVNQGETAVPDGHVALERTITELIWAPHELFADGLYLLNLHIPHWMTDAAPSRPLLSSILSIR